jgi:hypothetical protein
MRFVASQGHGGGWVPGSLGLSGCCCPSVSGVVAASLKAQTSIIIRPSSSVKAQRGAGPHSHETRQAARCSRRWVVCGDVA